MVLVGGDFRKYLGHENGALMNGISGFINELREVPNSLHHVRTQWEDTGYKPGRGPSPEGDRADIMILDLQPPDYKQ